MLKSIRSFLLVGLMLACYPIAHSTEIAAPSIANKLYTEDEQNIVVNVKSSEFSIKLKSNPTTGYSWFLREYDPNLVTPIKHNFLKPDPGLMGAPGYEVWVFKIKPIGFVVPHQTSLRLIYARPWQGDSSTQLVYRISTQAK